MRNEQPQPFSEIREKPWGHEIVWTPDTLDRVGKIIFVEKGRKLSLQYHDQKEETIMLFSGRALLWWQDAAGDIVKLPMEPRTGYTIYPGTIHRYEALEDTYLIEVSDRERGTTFRLADDYKRPNEVR